MAKTLDRLKSRVDHLIHDGKMLEYAMRNSIAGSGFTDQIKKALGAEKTKELIAKLPNFNTAYQAWYSETLALLKQVLPDRVADFISCYEKPKIRKSLTWENYVIQDYLKGLAVKFGGEFVVDSSAALPQFQQQLAILEAAKTRFESSLFEIKQLVQADLLDGELATAEELMKNKFFRAAGVIAGVVLEKHLSDICRQRNIVFKKKHAALNDLNEALRANSVIDIPQWRHISMLADIRNICAHGKAKEPTKEQVEDLIEGTSKVTKTIN